MCNLIKQNKFLKDSVKYGQYYFIRTIASPTWSRKNEFQARPCLIHIYRKKANTGSTESAKEKKKIKPAPVCRKKEKKIKTTPNLQGEKSPDSVQSSVLLFSGSEICFWCFKLCYLADLKKSNKKKEIRLISVWMHKVLEYNKFLTVTFSTVKNYGFCDTAKCC